MRLKQSVFLVLIMLAYPCTAQDWEKTMDGRGSRDAIQASRVSPEGDVYLGGLGRNLVSEGSNDDLWILKLSNSSNVLWEIRLDGKTGDDGIQAMDLDPLGNILVAGYGRDLSFPQSSDDIWILKIRPNGSIIWEDRFDMGGLDYAYAVRSDSQANIYVAGYWISGGCGRDIIPGARDWFLIKYSPNGSKIWSNTWDGADGKDSVTSLAIDEEDNVYLGGYGENLAGVGSSYDWWIKKINPEGELMWERKIDKGDIDILFALVVWGDHLIAGGFGSNLERKGTSFDGMLQKYDLDGNLVWERWFDIAGSSEAINSIDVDSSGVIWGVGYSENAVNLQSQRDFLIVAYTQDGELIGSYVADGALSADMLNSVVSTDDRGLLVAGLSMNAVSTKSYSDLYIRRIENPNDLFKVKDRGGQLSMIERMIDLMWEKTLPLHPGYYR